MNKSSTMIKDRFDWGIIPRLILFVILPNIVNTPLRIFVEAVIEGKKEAPAFVTGPFLIYGVCAELVVGFGTSFIKTFAYGIAYVIMIIICTFLYGLGKRSNRSELFQIQ